MAALTANCPSLPLNFHLADTLFVGLAEVLAEGCLPGATMDSLAIFGGGSGRRLQEVVVNRPIEVLEGTAAPLRQDWSWAGGGRGGGTQIFVTWHALFALDGLGTHGR